MSFRGLRAAAPRPAGSQTRLRRNRCRSRIDDPERRVFALLVNNRSQAKAVAHGAPTRYLVALSGYAAGAH